MPDVVLHFSQTRPRSDRILVLIFLHSGLRRYSVYLVFFIICLSEGSEVL